MRHGRKGILVLVAAIAVPGCGGGRQEAEAPGKERACPSGTVNANRTIVTMDCNTVVQYDGSALNASLSASGLGKAGIQHADVVLRQVSDATTEAQVQFTQACRVYNGCQMTQESFNESLRKAQDRARALREKIELIKAAEGKPEMIRAAVSELYETTVPAEKQGEQTLTLSFVAQAADPPGTPARAVKDGETLRTGAKLVFGLHVSQPAYAYVFERKKTQKTVDVLFPNPKISKLQNPIPAGTLVRIPPSGQVFTLDANDIGTENVVIAVSRHPIADLDGLAIRASDATQGDQQLERVVTDLVNQAAPECGTRGLEVTAQQGCGSVTRGITLEPAAGDDFFKGGTSVRAKSVPGDDVIVRTFTFEHTE